MTSSADEAVDYAYKAYKIAYGALEAARAANAPIEATRKATVAAYLAYDAACLALEVKEN
jgi:hypothetical protein